MNTPRSIAILGAGITGLTAAHRLHAQGHRVRVFEKSSRAGGAVGTELIGGWLIERGPNSLLAGDPALSALIRELNLEGECLVANPTAKKRFLVRREKPLAAPASPPAFFTSELFSAGAKFRILRELFTRPRRRPADVSLAEFVRSHFGSELVDYALNPFVGGVYAGNPDHLSAQHSFPALWKIEQETGSLLRGQIAQAKQRRASGAPRSQIISFQRGLQTLTDALATKLPAGAIALNAPVEALDRSSDWQVTWNDHGTLRHETFDLVLSALPAAGLAALRMGPQGDQPLASLAEIEHPPVTSLFLGYRREQVTHPLDGFGLLVPEVEKLSALGVLFPSTLFPGRAPDGHVALHVMVGGTRQPELALLDEAALLKRVQPDLAQLLGVSGEPAFIRRNAWRHAIPQYNLGYGRFLEAMTACETQNPGLLIGGQCRDGISVPACVAAGEKLAARAVAA